jgi:tetratricopeptide (TPR) repeat protein
MNDTHDSLNKLIESIIHLKKALECINTAIGINDYVYYSERISQKSVEMERNINDFIEYIENIKDDYDYQKELCSLNKKYNR